MHGQIMLYNKMLFFLCNVFPVFTCSGQTDSGYTIFEVIKMASYVSPKLREQFETLSVDLKNNILERDVQLNTIHDLIAVLEVIVREEEE